MKTKYLLGLFIIGLLLISGCGKFQKNFEKCVEEESYGCFMEGNCDVGTTIDDIKIYCCLESNRTPSVNTKGNYVACINF